MLAIMMNTAFAGLLLMHLTDRHFGRGWDVLRTWTAAITGTASLIAGFLFFELGRAETTPVIEGDLMDLADIMLAAAPLPAGIGFAALGLMYFGYVGEQRRALARR